MKIFESHAHLDFPNFDQDRDEIIEKCFKSGIEYIINIGIDEGTSRASVKLAEKYDRIYATVGFHPHDADKFNEQVLLELLEKPKVVGLGEIGLDFYRNYTPREIQEKIFEKQVKIAVEKKLPIVIHDREAHEECWEILDRHKPEHVVFHCFSGDLPFAEKVIGRGWMISIPGTITYKKSQLEDVVRNIPLESIMIETDCPFLSPVPVRGKRNSPLNLRYIIEKISEIKRTTPREVAEITYSNGVGFFLGSV